MKNTIHTLNKCLLIALILWAGTKNAVAQSFVYAQSYGANHFDEALSIAADNDNNLYMTGTFIGKWGWQDGDTLQAAGGTDFVIARLDNQGNPIWMRAGGGRIDDELAQLAVLPDGSGIYAAGWIRDTLVLGDTIATESLSGDNALLVKYDNNGNLQWTQQWPGKGISHITALLTDNNGQVYVGGIFTDSLLINNTDTLVSAGGFDMLLAKYDSNGNLISYKQLGGSQTEMLTTMTLTTDGAWYVGGYFVGSTGLGAFNLDSFGESDAFLLKTDNDGNIWWAKQFGGQYAESINKIAATNDGKIAICGIFLEQTTWDNNTLNAWGIDDIIVAQADNEGNLQWAINIGSAQNDAVKDITLDTQNNIYLAGVIGGNASFGGSLFLQTAGNNDAFAAKFSPNGTPLWAQAAGGNSSDSGNSIWINNNDNNCYWAGTYILQATFEEFILTSNGMADMFIAQIDQNIIDVSISPNTPSHTQLVVYPNPTTEFILAKIPHNILTNNTLISLSTLSGQIVYQTQLTDTHIDNTNDNLYQQISLQNLPKGIYLLTLNNEKTHQITKIIYR